MPVKITDIKKLRKKIGAPVMDCRRALEEAKGDFARAEKILTEKGIASAEKKRDRETTAGLVEAYIHANGKIGVLVELGCETDFVARTDDFKYLAHELAMQIAAMEPKDVENLLEQLYIRDYTITISDLVKRTIAKLGENVVIKRFTRFELGES
jgi:elongation factor Ts